MVAVYIPVLVSLLLDEKSAPQSSPSRRAIGDLCLDRLTELGGLYPDHLRTVMSTSPHLKPILAAAVKLRHASQEKAKAIQAAKSAGPTVAKPTITLKMNFGNFKT